MLYQNATFHKILVGLDHSELGQQVFASALDLAKITGATLLLIHVLCPDDEGGPKMPALSSLEYYPGLDSTLLEIYHEQWQRYEAKGMELLRSRANLATQAGASATILQTTGSPGRVLCETARAQGADLMMVGRRGLVGMQEIFLGSTSNYVLHHAPCSVLVINRAQPTTTADSKGLSGDRSMGMAV